MVTGTAPLSRFVPSSSVCSCVNRVKFTTAPLVNLFFAKLSVTRFVRLLMKLGSVPVNRLFVMSSVLQGKRWQLMTKDGHHDRSLPTYVRPVMVPSSGGSVPLIELLRRTRDLETRRGAVAGHTKFTNGMRHNATSNSQARPRIQRSELLTT